jgi:hypothetical protein
MLYLLFLFEFYFDGSKAQRRRIYLHMYGFYILSSEARSFLSSATYEK